MDMKFAEELLVKTSVQEVLTRFPYLANLFDAVRLEILDPRSTVMDILSDHPEDYFVDYGLSRQGFATMLAELAQRLRQEEVPEAEEIFSLQVTGGRNKCGDPENLTLTLGKGEIVCVVGPTGSGKSRLLEDIECLAQGDTPTHRSILINGALPTEAQRDRLEHRLIAELSQNMNFVIDLSVEAFLKLHAQSRSVEQPTGIISAIVACANTLSGEPLHMDTPVTQLSGGQSRALMIADTALLSRSPVILIDEIENAGIDRKRALELLMRQGKMILVSTHDPVLALMGNRRVVIENGGMHSVLETSPAEKKNLKILEAFDSFLLRQRDGIRKGKRLDTDLSGALLQLITTTSYVKH
ncbi:MAG: ATP-binding cassette domain-containing protein [Oscillospiraceae bacterium]